MRHQKILKREDGSRVQINVALVIEDYRNVYKWNFTVDACEKGKRTWMPPTPSDNYNYRRLDSAGREAMIKEISLQRATIAEIESVMLELWEMFRPEPSEFVVSTSDV